MDTVPDAPDFLPAGLPGGVYYADDGPTTNRLDFLKPQPFTNRLVFALYTVTVEEGKTYTVPEADVGAVAAMADSELEYFKASIDTMRDAEKDAATDRTEDVPDTTVYVTGHLVDGRKVGLVTHYRPFCEVELPDDPGAERWFLREMLGPLAWMCRLPPHRIGVHFHRAPRFYGYVPDPFNPLRRKEFLFARVSLPTTALMKRVASALRADYGKAIRLRSGANAPVLNVYEDGIDTVQKFVDAHGLVPCGWHEYVVGGCGSDGPTLVSRPHREMLVDLEFEVDDAKHLRYLGKVAAEGTDPHPSSVPPLLIAVLDAEMNSGFAGRMPRAFREDNPVITVSVVYAFCGGDTAEYTEFERHAYVLAPVCEPIAGVIVHLYTNEFDMLADIRDDMFVRKKVDVVAGHNLVRFDMEYLAGRVQQYGPDGSKRFLRFGVLLMQTLRLEAGDLSSSAYGSNRLSKLDGAGFVYVDTLLICKTSFKLRQNTLSCAAAHFLKGGAAKFDMPYDLIPEVAAGANPVHWRKLAAYCVQDSVLVLRLLGKWDSIKDLVAQSRIMNIPMAANVQSGQMERVRDYVMRDAHGPAFGMVMNGVNVRTGRREDDGAEHTSAVGGWVLDNIQGLHDCPILVLDFASLYPSVQDSKNLCWSTCVEAGVVTAAHLVAGLEVETHETATGTFQFVTNVSGVFPVSLRALRHERNLYKAEMKKHAYGTAGYQNADNAQKAIKIPMNSGYGTANCPRSKGGKMECIPLGTVTCHVGRQLNQMAAAFVQEHFHAEIIYGDTDSIMFRVPLRSTGASRLEQLVEAMAAGHAAEEAINAHLNTLLKTTAVKVEFEKVYYPFLSSGKKTYAGLKFEPGDERRADADLQTGGRVECKGLRTVRRDVPQFVAAMTETLLQQLFFQRDEDAFWGTVHTYAEKLVRGELPLEAYVITAELKSGYGSKASLSAQAAVSYAREYETRGNSFEDGDRVPFVFVEEADERRTVRPPWLDADIADAHKVADQARLDKQGGREFPVVAAVAAPAVFVVTTQPRFIALEGETVDDKKCKHARHPDEVRASPKRNTINVEHYMDCMCAVLEQLMPQAQGAQKELRDFVRAHKQYQQRQRSSSAGLGAFFGGVQSSMAANLPTLAHRKPVAPKFQATYTISGGVCKTSDNKPKKKTAARKPPPLKPAMKQRSVLDLC